MSKVTDLTEQQRSQLTVYRDDAIGIGMSVDDNYDLETVKGLILDLRKSSYSKMSNDLEKIKWLEFDSPFAAMQSKETLLCDSESGKNLLTTSNCLYGNGDSYWLYFYMFFREELGLEKETQEILPQYELAKHIGWFWMCDDVVVITRKPCKLNLVDRKTSQGETIKILHSLDEMALQYRDGTGIYKIDDVRIPDEYEWLFTDKSKRTPANIMAIENVDIRSAALKLLSPEGDLEQV